MAKTKTYTATETFHTEIDGKPVTVRKGDTVREGHELLKGGRDVNFIETDGGATHEVEEATAEPGKKRGAA